MTRNQYWTLFGGACLVAVLLLSQVICVNYAEDSQRRLANAQMAVTEGQRCEMRTRQLATRIYQVAQQTQDQGLKELMARQQIVSNPPAAPAAASAPAATSDDR